MFELEAVVRVVPKLAAVFREGMYVLLEIVPAAAAHTPSRRGALAAAESHPIHAHLGAGALD